MERPFLGLKSYEEQHRDLFGGRDNEIVKIKDIIERNTVSVIAGKSGVGKTSLIKAGLIPSLKKAFFLPIYLRVDFTSSESPLYQVKKSVSDILSPWLEQETKIDECSLFEYFHKIQLKEGLKIPILLFDQFEEVFTLGKQKPHEVNEFLLEIADLAEVRVPEEVRSKLQKAKRTTPTEYNLANYSVVFSLREDYLAQLEELNQLIPSLKQSRIRVKQLNPNQAVQAICKTAGPLLVNKDAERIVDYISQRQKDKHQYTYVENEIEPFLLSLICYQLNEERIKAGKKTISVELISDKKIDNIIRDFYEDTLRDYPKELKRAVEMDLVNEEGYRVLKIMEDFIRKNNLKEADVLELIEQKIIRKEVRNNVDNIELIHDVLVPPVKEKRDVRVNAERKRQEEAEKALIDQENRKKRTQKLLVAGIIVVFLIATGTTIGLIRISELKKAAETEKEKAQKARDEADDQRKLALVQQVKAEEQALLARNAEERAKNAERAAKHDATIAQKNYNKAEGLFKINNVLKEGWLKNFKGQEKNSIASYLASINPEKLAIDISLPPNQKTNKEEYRKIERAFILLARSYDEFELDYPISNIFQLMEANKMYPEKTQRNLFDRLYKSRLDLIMNDNSTSIIKNHFSLPYNISSLKINRNNSLHLIAGNTEYSYSLSEKIPIKKTPKTFEIMDVEKSIYSPSGNLIFLQSIDTISWNYHSYIRNRSKDTVKQLEFISAYDSLSFDPVFASFSADELYALVASDEGDLNLIDTKNLETKIIDLESIVEGIRAYYHEDIRFIGNNVLVITEDKKYILANNSGQLTLLKELPYSLSIPVTQRNGNYFFGLSEDDNVHSIIYNPSGEPLDTLSQKFSDSYYYYIVANFYHGGAFLSILDHDNYAMHFWKKEENKEQWSLHRSLNLNLLEGYSGFENISSSISLDGEIALTTLDSIAYLWDLSPNMETIQNSSFAKNLSFRKKLEYGIINVEDLAEGDYVLMLEAAHVYYDQYDFHKAGQLYDRLVANEFESLTKQQKGEVLYRQLSILSFDLDNTIYYESESNTLDSKQIREKIDSTIALLNHISVDQTINIVNDLKYDGYYETSKKIYSKLISQNFEQITFSDRITILGEYVSILQEELDDLEYYGNADDAEIASIKQEIEQAINLLTQNLDTTKKKIQAAEVLSNIGQAGKAIELYKTITNDKLLSREEKINVRIKLLSADEKEFSSSESTTAKSNILDKILSTERELITLEPSEDQRLEAVYILYDIMIRNNDILRIKNEEIANGMIELLAPIIDSELKGEDAKDFSYHAYDELAVVSMLNNDYKKAAQHIDQAIKIYESSIMELEHVQNSYGKKIFIYLLLGREREVETFFQNSQILFENYYYESDEFIYMLNSTFDKLKLLKPGIATQRIIDFENQYL